MGDIKKQVETNLETQKLLTNENKKNNKQLDDTNNKIKKIKDSTNGVGEAFTKIGDSIAQGVSDALVDAILQTKSLAQAASALLNDIARQFLRLGINTLLSSFGGPFAKLPTFAKGGRPPVGRPSIVGERGPELFVPSTAGTVIPNDKLGGGLTNNIVVNVSMEGGVEAQGGEQEGRELGRLIAVAVQSEIIQQKRAGGLLA